MHTVCQDTHQTRFSPSGNQQVSWPSAGVMISILHFHTSLFSRCWSDAMLICWAGYNVWKTLIYWWILPSYNISGCVTTTTVKILLTNGEIYLFFYLSVCLSFDFLNNCSSDWLPTRLLYGWGPMQLQVVINELRDFHVQSTLTHWPETQQNSVYYPWSLASGRGCAATVT